MFSHWIFRIKRFLVKKQKQNGANPQWIWIKTGNKIRYNSKSRFWRRIKLGLEGESHMRHVQVCCDKLSGFCAHSRQKGTISLNHV
ncbi:60S ribosomal protein L39-like [Sorex araneus]|uniref:60S ribosomal protein L39-like n=1 Tax=Sorex araneus TaxID=42254 RepID=UPI002433F3B9|nr:60S ribosomal protein L39-like [Sorex araneus]